MIRLDAATVLLQWSVGGLTFLWVTERARQVGVGYGWLLRGVYGLMAAGGLVVGVVTESVPAREIAAGVVVMAVAVGIVATRAKQTGGSRGARLGLGLVAPSVGVVALVAAGLDAGGPPVLAVARTLIGAAFLGAVSDAMLLGHWYLVQPGLARGPLLDLVRWARWLWPVELGALLWPTGMMSVLAGTVDDGYGGLLGWFWLACSVASIALLGATRAALRERQYSAVMSATGLLYLAILTSFGMDLVARACLS
ncbi:MAG: hypothetical protein VX833_00910 [Actinomycetota bacterium]|nr:hypothetical protein [Actinomycetota bacterium]